MTATLPTPNEVVHQLVDLAAYLDAATRELAELDEKAVRAKVRHEVAYARAFLNAEGAADTRKQTAVEVVKVEKWDLELAEAKVRACKERLRTLRDQVDIRRSMGAALRSEWAATP